MSQAAGFATARGYVKYLTYNAEAILNGKKVYKKLYPNKNLREVAKQSFKYSEKNNIQLAKNANEAAKEALRN